MTGQVIQDIPRLYTAIAEWLACMLYVCLFRRRLHRWRFGVVAAAFLLVQSAFLMVTDDVPIGFWLPCMAVAIGLMFSLIYACCDISVLNAGYYCVRAVILAEFSAALEWQLYYYYYSAFRFEYDSFWGRTFILLVVYTGVFGLIYYLESRRKSDIQRMRATMREFWSVTVIGAAVFLMSNISYVYSNTPFSGQFAMDIFNARTLVDLGGVAILYAYHVQRSELHMKYELDAINNILQNQYMQYRQSKESIDMINRKYHDLKHQITALRDEPDMAKRSAWLDEMENDIKTYEAQNKTGNKVLDTILTSKSMICQKQSIGLTTIADGKLLDFMDVMDICTIFGNALDNAIECEIKIAQQEKRLIHLSVFGQKDFLLIRIENYYEDQLQFEEGLPITTKKNSTSHGYGLKSIQYAAKKYGGTVTICTEKNWFELKVLIPIPKTQRLLTKM